MNDLDDVDVGSQIRFIPNPGGYWWNVRARNERFIIATRQVAFKPKGELEYSVVDLTGWTYTYNFVSPGVVRSSVNTIGGGYDVSGDGCNRMLDELIAEEVELSRRRVLRVDAVISNR